MGRETGIGKETGMGKETEMWIRTGTGTGWGNI
jgi:hypothetical protein